MTTASSSKRPATCSPSTFVHPNKQQRKSQDASEAACVASSEAGDEEEVEMDEEARAKLARKEARIIRNRESAQRSRNARKQHLVWLESRVVELEAENRTLRGENDTPGPSVTTAFCRSISPFQEPLSASTSSVREPSPAQSVLSLANDLGLPSELVGSTGVKLSSVAPLSVDLASEMGMETDVKPDISGDLSMVSQLMLDARDDTVQLREENKALKERVGLLENLVKQVVALSNLGGLPLLQTDSLGSKEGTCQTILEAPAGLEATLSPSFYKQSLLGDQKPSTSLDTASPLPQSDSHTDTFSALKLDIPPLACHSAVVATSSFWDRALQRARGFNAVDSVDESLEAGEMDVVEWDMTMERLIEDLENRNAMREGTDLGSSMGEWKSPSGIIV
ncbi:uncharacterized protein L203_100834 [Cryptococcus depauperatus CBS 7841]|uniref:Uncharacterized protein n=1 Tax=Cryptococcus depauperatus CBS 7841 TaxID=1295531 RepID=A0A1E3IXJ1_9TREE|nr:hypothetical protein L203_00624 [Cryptococcus depauperatus CBS 7841]